ncbi:MAG: IS1 family transposase [Bacteroidales bacterium]|jgi:transposase-like protein|nr:IS1 family transposase [Bacteroidales bacterium]
MKCPKCSCGKSIKFGIIKGKQRYKCKKCGYNYTVALKSTMKPKSLKKKALYLYLEGMGFRSIGRILGVSNVSVLNWIKSFGKEIERLAVEDQKIKVVEVDEIYSYIVSKKIIADSKLLLIDVGADSTTLLLTTETIKQRKPYALTENGNTENLYVL